MILSPARSAIDSLSILRQARKMWSVGLIVGVAVVASLLLLIVGIVLTITLERRRYCRYIKRHTAGTAITTEKKAPHPVSDGTDRDVATYQSLQQNPSYGSPRARSTSPCPSSNEENGPLSPIWRPTANCKPARRKSFHRTLRSTITKRRSQRRCLRKRTAYRKYATSPLSAITEVTDVTPSSSTHRSRSSGSGPALSAKKREDRLICRWPFQYRGLRALAIGDLPHTMSNTYHSSSHQYLHYVPGFVKETDLGSKPMVTQLEISPTHLPNGNCNCTEELRTSKSSVGSTSSSILQNTPSKGSKEHSLVEKTRSQALHDFEFNLGSSMKLKSPKHVASPVRQDPRAAATRSLRASLSPELNAGDSAHPKSKQAKWLLNPDSITAPTTGPVLVPSSRHSMVDNIQVLWNWPSQVSSRHESENDPFITKIQSRPVSIEGRTPLGGLNLKSSARYAPTHYGTSAPRSIQWYGSPIPAIQKLRNASMAYDSTMCAGPNVNLSRHQTYASKHMQDMRARGSPKGPRMHLNGTHGLLPQKNSLKSASPTTPSSNTSSSNYHWKFDFVLANSPKPSASSSPLRSYNSPILPSPAYTPANLHPRPRQPRVMGPRSPRRPPPQSPLNPNIRPQQNIHTGGVVKCNPKKRVGSTDLLRSIQILRSMNSECQLPHVTPSVSSCRLTSRNEGDNDLKSMERGKQASGLGMSTSLVFKSTSLRRMSSLNGTSKTPMPRPQSSASVGGISVWEDESVYDDSPKSELPCEVSLTSNTSPTTDSLSRTNIGRTVDYSNQTYNATTYEYENFFQPNVVTEQKVGLGLKFVETAVPDTPRDMYDESGFLKV